jgi:uncharacterized protein
MLYRNFGSTGKKVSVIGFGGMRFKDQKDIEQCQSLVNAAYQAGINYFDTAPGYGKSEELFGEAFKHMLKSRAQKPFYVATKTMKSDPGEIRRQLEKSLTRMGLDYIDFYYVWCIQKFEEYQQRKTKGLFDGFQRLKEQGLIKHICISSHLTGDQTGQLLADYPFEGVLLGYSAMNFAYRQTALTAAAKQGIGVAIMNPLGGGVIAQNSDKFEFVKTSNDETAVEGALRFLIDDQRITTMLVGLSDLDQLTQTISAVNGYKPISSQMIEKIKNSLSQAFNELCTMCRYCDNCPKQIPIPKLMDAYNHYVLSGNVERMIGRIEEHWDIDLGDKCLSSCSECGLCQKACTQHLPIINRLRCIQTEVQKHLQKKKADEKSDVSK